MQFPKSALLLTASLFNMYFSNIYWVSLSSAFPVKKAHRVKVLIRIFPFFARLLFGDVDFLLHHIMSGSLSLYVVKIDRWVQMLSLDSAICLWCNDFSRYLMIIT